MARFTPKQIKIIEFGILGGIIVGLLSLIVLIFSLIADLITVPGAIAVFILGIWLTVRFLIRLMIFPGSVWLWRRYIETHFCREMAQQTYHRMHDLRIGLEILLDLSNEQEKTEFLARSAEATAYGKRILATLIHTFQCLKEEETLTKYQEELLNLLLELQSALEYTRIVQNNHESCSMWDWMEASYEESDWLNVVFDDFPNNTNAQTARELIIKLEDTLYSSCGEVSFKDKIKRWMYDTRLGTIDQMRVELMSRFNCEQIWLSAEDGVLIDCLWIPGVSNSADAPTILLCNPNAGFYEFAYYQNEWLDFYLNSGINVFMWNYRGYGRTKGSPSLARIQQDGAIIIDYLKRVRKVGRLGVHGESLGGCVATHLARNCDIDFLFADRSFSSISEVALYNFGKFGYWIYRLSRNLDTDSAMDFLAVDCYKILSADPQDGMINDMASLKSGVAIRLVTDIQIETQGECPQEGVIPAKIDLKKYSHILRPRDTEIFLNSLLKLMNRIVLSNQVEENGTSRDSPDNSSVVPQNQATLSQFNLLSKDGEQNEDYTARNLLQKVFTVFDGLDAGGKPLSLVYSGKQKIESLKQWLICLDVWGCYLPVLPGDLGIYRARSEDKLKLAIEDLHQIFQENERSTYIPIVEICREIKDIEVCLTKLLHYVQSRFDTISSSKSSQASTAPEQVQMSKSKFEYVRAGYLIPLTCGHSGPYNPPEKLLYEAHLSRVRFID